MARVLVIEDEKALAVGLVDVLRVKGYEVDWESRGDEGLIKARAQSYDLILLDAELPGCGGFEILKALRSEGDRVPVIMLTARKTEMDRVLGFELGVDDYVTKPFSLLELLGRIGALLRRSRVVRAEAVMESDGKLCFGTTVVDLDRFTVRRGEQEIALPAKAFEILRVLRAHQGQVVSRDDLMDEVWGAEEAVTLRTLNNVMVKLRQAIEETPQGSEYLKTVHGVGYRLVV